MIYAQSLKTLEDAWNKARQNIEREKVAQEIWNKKVSLWSSDPEDHEEISNRLGWLTIVERMESEASELLSWAEKTAKNKVKHVFLLGMGGSALAGEVMGKILPRDPAFPELHVLDTTDPEDVVLAIATAKKEESLFIAASKSGTTVEMTSLMEIFLETHAPDHFIAITDEGSQLQTLAEDKGFARVFLNDPTIGGRFSALSYFGLVPAALSGIDVRKLLAAAAQTTASLKEERVDQNPGLQLGLFMGLAAKEGRDKFWLRLDGDLMPFGLWVEQLVAESSGKNGKGIVPFPIKRDATMRELEDSTCLDISMESAKEEGSLPLLKMQWDDPYDMGRAFLEWEFAIAVACHVLDVNAFDQPNVQDAKIRAKKALKGLSSEKETENFKIECSPNVSQNVNSTDEAYEALTKAAKKRDYMGVLAYLPTGARKELEKLKSTLEAKTERPVSLQFGPRYLHSTGQLHKGGKNDGLFLLLMRKPDKDVAVPGQTYTLGQLQRAQAQGDFEALIENGRRAILLDAAEPSSFWIDF